MNRFFGFMIARGVQLGAKLAVIPAADCRSVRCLRKVVGGSPNPSKDFEDGRIFSAVAGGQIPRLSFAGTRGLISPGVSVISATHQTRSCCRDVLPTELTISRLIS